MTKHELRKELQESAGVEMYKQVETRKVFAQIVSAGKVRLAEVRM